MLQKLIMNVRKNHCLKIFVKRTTTETSSFACSKMYGSDSASGKSFETPQKKNLIMRESPSYIYSLLLTLTLLCYITSQHIVSGFVSHTGVLNSKELLKSSRKHSKMIMKRKETSGAFKHSPIHRPSSTIMSVKQSIEDAIVSVLEVQGPFTPQMFANTKCWGTQPLLIRSAFDPVQIENNFGAWPSKEDLSMLACDEDAESRIITHYPGDDSSYELQIGPFFEEDIEKLLEGIDETDENIPPKWTLLVNDVDRFHPPLADWMHSSFSFIPTWRRDDGQLSLAQKGGGIGPHVDNYDVFLIQTSGQREWKIGNRIVTVKEEMEKNIPGLDLRILGENIKGTSSEELLWEPFILEPGDCMYLPPRVAHQGIAQTDDCITLSVGCRAPSAADMISKIAEDMAISISGKAVERYQDSNLLRNIKDQVDLELKCAEITEEAKDEAKQVVKKAMLELLDDDDAWDKWFGSFISEPKRIRVDYPMVLSCDDNQDSEHEEFIDSLGVWGKPKDAVKSLLIGEGSLYQAEGITFGYSRLMQKSNRQGLSSSKSQGKYSYRLFVNGLSWNIESPNVPIQKIASERRLSRESFQSEKVCDETITILEDLVEKGLLYGSAE